MKLVFPWNYLKTPYKQIQLQELKKLMMENMPSMLVETE